MNLRLFTAGEILFVLLVFLLSVIFGIEAGISPVATVCLSLIFLLFAVMMIYICFRIQNLEKRIVRRERMMKFAIDDLSFAMSERYDKTYRYVDDVVRKLEDRLYR